MKTLYKLIYILLSTAFIYGCSVESSDSSSSPDTGKAGSLARFAISGDYLYTVGNNDMKLFNISTPDQPSFTNDIELGVGIETIFPKDNYLFIGSMDGMYIYDISNPSAPVQLSNYWHIVSCDPVVVEGNYAYVTLHSEDSRCGRLTNELQVIDISNLRNPKEVKSINLTSPRGLGIQDGKLFVCDNVLRVFDLSSTPNITQIEAYNVRAFDIIPNDSILILIGEDGLYQFAYSGSSLSQLSLIPTSIN